MAGMRRFLACLAMICMTGCTTSRLPPLDTVDRVDLERFMGNWYVIAHIPTAIEKNAFNAVESYELERDGTIATTFTFREGGFDGELKRYTPRGFVRDARSNAVWGMQFIWPIKAQYLIIGLDDAYTRTVIARDKRDYVWIMARTPQIPEEYYLSLVEDIAAVGYDTSRLRKVPQQWQ